MERYVSLINIGGDYCGMGLGKDYPEDAEDEYGQSRANPAAWVRADAAQARIAELEAEVAELKEIVRILARSNILKDRSLEEAIEAKDTAWNDALDAAVGIPMHQVTRQEVLKLKRN